LKRESGDEGTAKSDRHPEFLYDAIVISSHISHLLPNKHRRRDSTRQMRRVGGVYWAYRDTRTGVPPSVAVGFISCEETESF